MCNSLLGDMYLVFGQEKVANDRRPGALVLQASPRGDPAHRCNTRKPMNWRQGGVTHDGRASRFAAVVSGLVDLLGGAALARSRKLLGDGCEQGPPVGFDRQNIIAAALEYRVGKGAVAMERIRSDDAPVDAPQNQQCHHAPR